MRDKTGKGRNGRRRSARPAVLLKNVEAMYRSLVDNSIHGLALFQNGRVVFCNQALTSLIGSSYDELLRMTPAEMAAIVHPQDRSSAIALMRERFEGKALSPGQSFRIVDKGGRARWVETTSVRTELNGTPALQVSCMDVTERVNAEAALLESETKLRSLITQSILGVVLIDRGGRIVEWNGVMEEITGMPASAVRGHGPEILRPLFDDGTLPIEEAIAGIARGREDPHSRHELKIRSVGGAERRLQATIFPIRFADGSMVAMIGEDTTVRRQAEEAYRALVDNSLEGFAIIQDGRIVFCNQALTRMSGYSPEETRRFSPGEIAATLHPEDRARVMLAMQEILQGKSPVSGQQVRMLSKGGQVHWVEIFAVRIEYNSLPALQVSYLDVTERHEAEVALRESEARFRTVIEKAPVAIGIAREGKTVYGNDAFLRKFGIERLEDVVGRDLTEQVAPHCREEVLERALLRARGAPVEADFEISAIRKDRLQFPCRVAVTLFDLADGPATLAFFSDLTAMKEAEQKLTDSQSKLRNLAIHLLHAREQERATVAREIHDELGQILTALKMDLRWIEKRLDSRIPRIMEKIHGVVGLVDQTIQIVHRISSGLRPGMLDDLGLAAATEWLGADFSRRIGIPCRVTVTARESRIGANSSTALFRIIQEALTNVARHAKASHAFVELEESGGQLLVRVGDDGIGITEDQSMSPNAFGLIGIRERVQSLGGKMSVTGQPDKGTILVASIPLPPDGALA